MKIIPKEINLLNLANQPLPMDPTDKVKAEIDTRLDSRFIDLRRDNVSAIFKIKNRMFHTVRDFFYENGFMEINTPKLVASATEGGTELFPITYFEKEAFLGQSPQLYKQMMMSSGMDKVFEIGQIFRAEEHDTLRHLNEAVSIDAEASFMDDIDVMKILNNMLEQVIIDINEDCKEELNILQPGTYFSVYTATKGIDFNIYRIVSVDGDKVKAHLNTTSNDGKILTTEVEFTKQELLNSEKVNFMF